MAITASLVKELRERTGAGMMECKKALVETDGNIETAIENMRKSGQAKAAKKAGRIAAEGLIVFAASDDNKSAAMVEVNCETDFVAKDENFSSFANAVAERTLNSDVADVETLVEMPLHDGEEATIAGTRDALISKIGENMSVRRFVRINSSGGVYSYRHGVRIGVLVDMEGGDAELGRDIAMHIAASTPVCVSADDVPAEKLASEREIFRAQALESGKPEAIVDKIIEGRVRKYLEEITLNGQAFVKDPDVTVGKLLEKAGAKVIGFTRYEVGEGIEKKQEDFAAEVMAQVQGS
ncbi:translation elongation factor Ts [Solemya elarraichensis gill symbiont]|uniref:Elongation factor Ts n=1 Tax=Solemya elarraichensis gill symbiont TaxID=1918949 RepID=A0A1T2L773_9GAMM|nr:translation elongation factor Ts [Solemya elarraichensis gill symbiont]OOZ40796.1 translation elongation factor Ts [Solemya elarraichensis gill symbiont]